MPFCIPEDVNRPVCIGICPVAGQKGALWKAITLHNAYYVVNT